MIKRSVLIRLRDMLDAIDDAIEITNGATFDDYQRSVVMRRAIERCVEIVSEASRHVPDAMKKMHPDAKWHEIRAIGNILRHEYQRVDNLIMWRIAETYFPELRPVIAAMLNERDET